MWVCSPTRNERSRCRFFIHLPDFEREVQLYRDPLLRRVLPSLLHASDNSDRAAHSRSGFVFPPFFVLERGMTLQEWIKQPRGFFEVSVMVEHIARLLHTLHAAERVHRDLKPANVLYMLQSTQWRLLDLGIAGSAGALQSHAKKVLIRVGELHGMPIRAYRCSIVTLRRMTASGQQERSTLHHHK